MLCRIYWKDKNGFVNQGKPTDENSAKSWVNEMNKKYPYMDHWIVPVEEGECLDDNTIPGDRHPA